MIICHLEEIVTGDETWIYHFKAKNKVWVSSKAKNQRTEGPESRTDGETLIFWD